MTGTTRPGEERSARFHDRRYRRIWRWSVIASVLFHILVLFVFRQARPIPQSPFAAAGPRSGDARAAAGGGMEAVTLRVQPTVTPTVPVNVPLPAPVPVPVPDPAPPIEDPTPAVAAVTDPTIGTVGQGRGAAAGAGIEGGTGRGDGGTADEGLFRVLPPSPRGLILPPSDRPGRVRGKEVDVWVFIDTRGQVVADSTRLDPATTGDRKFDDRLRKQAAEWVFDPARRGGRVVAEWFRYTIIF